MSLNKQQHLFKFEKSILNWKIAYSNPGKQSWTTNQQRRSVEIRRVIHVDCVDMSFVLYQKCISHGHGETFIAVFLFLNEKKLNSKAVPQT